MLYKFLPTTCAPVICMEYTDHPFHPLVSKIYRNPIISGAKRRGRNIPTTMSRFKALGFKLSVDKSWVERFILFNI